MGGKEWMRKGDGCLHWEAYLCAWVELGVRSQGCGCDTMA